MTEVSPASLCWAQLAYLANGPDPYVALLAFTSSAAETLDLVTTALDDSKDLTVDEVKVLSGFSLIKRNLTHGFTTIDRPVPRALTGFLAEHFIHWRARWRDLKNMSADALVDHLTFHDRYDILTPSSSLWPVRLWDLMIRAGAATPLCLWVEGDVTALTRGVGSVGIVGSRESTAYGETCAHDIAQRVSLQGFSVFSGGAMGIDASAHWGWYDGLSAQSGTSRPASVAFCAGGLRHLGPSRNLRLFDEMASNGGALVSELPPDTVSHPKRFLARNRLIAAMSDCVVVAQARFRSGALNTAQWANELGRTVVAIPGLITTPENAGCNRLIAEQKATILTSVTDIDAFLPQLGTLPFAMPPTEPDTSVASDAGKAATSRQGVEATVLDLLKATPALSTEGLIESLDARGFTLTPAAVNRILGKLELEGRLPTTTEKR